MCTISFLPKSRGFYLAMNRDEKRDRSTGLAPTVVKLEKHRAMFPREPTGGTWISANDAGVCLALINWHRIKREPNNGIRSRGEVISKLAGISTSGEISAAIKKLPLRKLRPFRLVAIAPAESRLIEWRWNLNRLSKRKHFWKSRHWFSSGFDEATAEAERTRVCSTQPDESVKRDLKWLRHLHRSHEPERGPFSICMHRADAATVSYTEVAVNKRSIVMRYKDGPPCSPKSATLKTCKLSRVRTTNR
jgi:transport and Golgi organization protein 2